MTDTIRSELQREFEKIVVIVILERPAVIQVVESRVKLIKIHQSSDIAKRSR